MKVSNSPIPQLSAAGLCKPVPKPRRYPPISKPPVVNPLTNPPASTMVSGSRRTSVHKNVILPPAKSVGVASRFSSVPAATPKCNSFPPSTTPSRRRLQSGQKAALAAKVIYSSAASVAKRPPTAKAIFRSKEKTDLKPAAHAINSRPLMDLKGGHAHQPTEDKHVSASYLTMDTCNQSPSCVSNTTYSPPTYTPTVAAPDALATRSKITLLEQLIKSHPIWYLQHLGRAAANHLLRPMGTGVFLVRASSRSTSASQVTDARKGKRSSKTTTMALSVRLPRECSTDIDHYLIETASSDNHSIRLEGSPHTFTSLPLLLQHYCLNGEELQTRLSLPWAISSCQSIQGLQALALMGQDFWTSEVSCMSLSPSNSITVSPVQPNARQLPMVMHNPMVSPRRACSSANSSNCSTSTMNQPAKQQPLKMSRSVSSTGTGIDQMFKNTQVSKVASIFHRGTSAAGMLKHEREVLPEYKEKGKVKKLGATSTARLPSSSSFDAKLSSANTEFDKFREEEKTSCAANSTFILSQGGMAKQASPAISQESAASNDQSHGLLKKSQSAYEDIRTKSFKQSSQQLQFQQQPLHFNIGKRSGSVKTESSNGSNSFGHNSSNFLRNLFSSSNQSTSSTLQGNTSSLDHCDLFMPYVSNNASDCNSQSDAMIWANSPSASGSQVSVNDRIPSNYVFDGTGNQQNDNKPPTDSSSDTIKSTKRKGFARLKSTLKMPFSAGAQPPTKSKDDSNHHSLSNEVVLARQLAFRRTNTDLCAESVHRLVGHHSIDDSPPPTISQPQLRRVTTNSQHQAIAAIHRHHRIHQKVVPVQQTQKSSSSFLPPTSKERKGSKMGLSKPRRSNSQMGERTGMPLIPPSGRQKMDDLAMRKCIDELRSKRMQSTLAASDKLNELLKDSNQVVLRNNPEELFLPAKRDILQERFSVPNMIDGEREDLMQNISVADSVRELTAKFGSSRNGAGELQTINEGLITPAVRRKQFLRAGVDVNNVSAEQTTLLLISFSPEEQSEEEKQKSTPLHQLPEKETMSEAAVPNEQEEAYTSHVFQHREVAVLGASEEEEAAVATIIKPPAHTSRASKIAVATVRPQQHNLVAMEHEDLQHQHIVCDIVVGKSDRCNSTPVNQQRSPTEEPPLKRQSEYAQLSELVQHFENSSCADPLKTKTLELPSNTDEDAVSIAGTDFNEPWDSNAWDNLLDLAKFGDEKPSTANAIRTLHSNDTIIEEDNLSGSAITADEEIEEELDHHPANVVILRPRTISSTCSVDKSNSGGAVEAGGRSFRLLALNNYGYESESLADEEDEEQDEFAVLTSEAEASTSNYLKESIRPDRLCNKEAAAMAAVLATNGCGDGNSNWQSYGISAWMKPREDRHIPPIPLVEERELRSGRQRGGSQQLRSSNTNHTTSSTSLQRGRMSSQQNNNTQPGQFNSAHGSLTDMRVPSLSPVISPARLRNLHNHSQDSTNTSDPSCILQKYVEYLAADESTVFGATLHRFIECTIESEETDPSVVIRRVRQFLNGMKNYLVKNGELDLHGIIERESEKLNANEFLNIDAIFEAVLNKILLVPIKAHLYHLMVRENTRNGELQRLSENLSFIRAMEPQELGFAPHTSMPDQIVMEHIRGLFRKMQNHYSPLKKLDNLLRALSMVVLNRTDQNGNGGSQRSTPVPPRLGESSSSTPIAMLKLNCAHLGVVKHPPVEELIRWMVYLLAKCSAINCEIEAWYMWELLPQQLLTTGDAAYYLSTLFSAVQVLKNPDSIRRLKNISAEINIMGSLNTLQEGSETEPCDSFLRIAVPNEQEGSIEYHTFPVLPQMNVAKLCRVISHQFAITNPEDYGLYILFDGFETYLLPKEYPHRIRDQLSESGKSHLFAYKRNEARIAWPKNAVSCCTDIQPRVGWN